MPSSRSRPVALRGDEEELFQEHRERLVRLVRADTRAPRPVCEDAVSHAFEQLCLTQPGRERIAGWLRVVARNEAWRLLRKQAREPLAADALKGEGPGGSRFSIAIDEVEASPVTTELVLEAHEALRTLARLKGRQRATLALKVAGYSYREIQALRRVTYTNVNRHMTEGRAAARKLRDAA
jgi:DNA-directed RNA polymerase specialized sigma24 family protein